MIHLEPGHRIVAETLAARFHAPPDKREAVDVTCSDFGCQYYVCVQQEEKHILRVSLWLRCYDEIRDMVGEKYFQDLYAGMLEPMPRQNFKITLAVNLDQLPPDAEGKGALAAMGACMGRGLSGGGRATNMISAQRTCTLSNWSWSASLRQG